MNRQNVPRDSTRGMGTRRKNLEKDLPAEQHLQEKNARVQNAHEIKERAADPEKTSGQGKKEAGRLICEKRNLTFPRSVRVRSRADYLKVQRSGRKSGGRYLIVLSMDNGLPVSRFGITVSRKTGNAVTRNRVKRRIRELQRLRRGDIVAGKDIVVVATRQAPRATFEAMEREYGNLMEKAGLTAGTCDR